jgi:uncharacterized protein YbcI
MPPHDVKQHFSTSEGNNALSSMFSNAERRLCAGAKSAIAMYGARSLLVKHLSSFSSKPAKMRSP